MQQGSLAFDRLDRDAVLRALSHHQGKGHGVAIGQLVYEATGQEPDPAAERRCRRIISELREEGTAICATPRTGYYIARTQDELDTCCNYLRERAMHSLKLESRLRRVALPDLLNQLRFTE